MNTMETEASYEDFAQQYIAGFIDIGNNALQHYADLPPEWRQSITGVVRNPDHATSADVSSGIARSIVAEWPQSETASEAIGRGMNEALWVAATVDGFKSDALGMGGSTRGSNTLATHTMEQLAFYTAAQLDQFDPDVAANDIHDRHLLAQDIAKRNIPTASWMSLKATGFMSTLYEAQSLRKTMLANQHELEAMGTSNELGEQLRAENDILWHEIRANQTYGVKPALVPAHTPGVVEWLFRDQAFHLDDPDAGETRARNQLAHGPTRAYVLGADTPMVRTSVGVESVTSETDNIATSAVQTSQLFATEGPADRANFYGLCVRNDGHLNLSRGTPLDQLAEANGLGVAYEQLRAEVLSVYCDLVVPVYVQEIAAQEQAAIQHELTEVTGPGRYNQLRALVLARTRTLQVLHDDMKEQVRLEREEERRITEDRPSNLVNHPVVGHIRTLPAHYRATPEARELCRLHLGRELAEYGETFVKEHTRGNVKENDPKGHRARLKAGKEIVRRQLDPNSPVQPRERKQKHRRKR